MVINFSIKDDQISILEMNVPIGDCQTGSVGRPRWEGMTTLPSRSRDGRGWPGSGLRRSSDSLRAFRLAIPWMEREAPMSNGDEANQPQISKSKAVRRAIAAGIRGVADGVEWIRQEFGIEVEPQFFAAVSS